MNKKVLNNKEYYKNKGCWCDEESPFVREVGGKETVTFTEPQKMYDFLSSPESDYMYSDCEDIILISNFGITLFMTY